ncbi:MAG: FAD-dependent monooxygenase [Chitinophagaceae bacterium]|nr:FAD-dependent monooxygenase [Chitinophagaceae bacterium]
MQKSIPSPVDMENKQPSILIAGAGLVGSLLAIFLAKRGHRVQVLEKRSDPRNHGHNEGRSINLALSHRGLRALEAAHIDLPKHILAEAVPMYGRQMHNESGQLSFLPYSSTNECIYSVSRSGLNNCLIEQAEKQGVEFLFEHHIEATDFSSRTIQVLHDGKQMVLTAPVLCAADGVFSKVRLSLEQQYLCRSTLEKIDHGYKELDIPIEKGMLLHMQTALHIWPRGQYMLIALPNFDGSYTGTLFLPFADEALSFQELKDDQSVTNFFNTHFPDTLPLLPNLPAQYFAHPTSSLANVFTDRWAFDSWLLIGDAAHGIVPFYGQGMNAGFEDCRLLDELLSIHHDDFSRAFSSFASTRKKDTDAIARLAMDNFIEMRDLVADERFILQKKIESALTKAFPDQWKTLYSEVTFSDTPYHEAFLRGQKNQRVMDQLMQDATIDVNRWQEKEIWERMIKQIEKWSGKS